MATKVLPCLICVFVLLALSLPECDAFGNGAIPGKRSFQEKNNKRVNREDLKASGIPLIFFLFLDWSYPEH